MFFLFETSSASLRGGEGGNLSMKVEKVLLGAGKRLSLSGWMYRKAIGAGREQGGGGRQQRWWQIHTQHMIYLSKNVMKPVKLHKGYMLMMMMTTIAFKDALIPVGCPGSVAPLLLAS